MPSTVITVRVCHTRKGFDFGVHMFNHYTFPGKPFIERFISLGQLVVRAILSILTLVFIV
jgi:hypothetical protein